jgi:hypothetical protein
MISKRSNMKDFTLYPEALALKELGFDEPCFGKWLSSLQSNWKDYTLILEMGMNEEFEDNRNVYLLQGACSALTYQQAFRFFRDKYNINTVISWRDDLLNYDISLTEMKKHGYFYYKDNFTTYEEAELECLKQLIKIVKNK